jgi:hypothetical protein
MMLDDFHAPPVDADVVLPRLRLFWLTDKSSPWNRCLAIRVKRVRWLGWPLGAGGTYLGLNV